MNLHQMVAGAIGMVNPFQQIEILRSTGYITNPDGSREPAYETLSGPAQIQDLSTDELRLLSDVSINVQANRKVIYINGNWSGIVRADQTGGDVFRFNGHEWLVTMVAEQWPDWTKVIVTMQSPRLGSSFTKPPPVVRLISSDKRSNE